MTTAKTDAQNSTALTPALIAQITGLVIKGLADAGTITAPGGADAVTAGLAKAHEMLNQEGTKQVTDQWDGRPGAPLAVTRTGGPNSTVAPGSVIAGVSAEASGGANMESLIRHYSDLAAQAGVAAATEKLGREIGSVRGAVKSLVDDVLPGIAASIKAIHDTVAESAKAAAVAKAEDEKKEKAEDAEEAKEMAAKAFTDEIENDADRTAAHIRVMAKAQLTAAQTAWASVATAAAKSAVALLTDVDAGITVAKALADSARTANPNSAVGQQRLDAAIIAFAKSIPSSPHATAEWPVVKASAETKEKMDEGSKDDSGKDGKPGDMDMAKAISDIQAALTGVGMLQTTVGQLVAAVSGQSRSTSGLPPVFELTKASVSDLDAISTKIHEAATRGDLTPELVDTAQDFMGRVRAAAAGNLNPLVVQAAFKRLPDALRSLFPQEMTAAA